MRGRPVALGACTVALLLGAATPAVGQDAPMPPAAKAPAPGTAPPAPEPAPGPAEAAPSTAPPADAAPEPAAPPASAEPLAAQPGAPATGPKPSTGPVVEETAATPPRAEPAATPPRRAGRAARATTGAGPRKGVVRTRPRRAANMSQADVQVSEFGGRVTLADVQVLGCSESSCDSGWPTTRSRTCRSAASPAGTC